VRGGSAAADGRSSGTVACISGARQSILTPSSLLRRAAAYGVCNGVAAACSQPRPVEVALAPCAAPPLGGACSLDEPAPCSDWLAAYTATGALVVACVSYGDPRATRGRPSVAAGGQGAQASPRPWVCPAGPPRDTGCRLHPRLRLVTLSGAPHIGNAVPAAPPRPPRRPLCAAAGLCGS